jgi:nitrite reductase/ring-hydroxylating ferredoxin subunit
MAWTDLLWLTDLDRTGRSVIRHEGRQILVLRTSSGIAALPNRCPHEGYPLSEGSLSCGSVLTCNWHNWKFDLASGETLVGGDRLIRYPVRVEGGKVLVDLAPPDPAASRESIRGNLEAALARVDEQRLVRETARLARLGADPVDAVRTAILWAADRLEFGTTHAIAGAPDWLALYDRAVPGSGEALAALGEILGHLADDALAARTRFPYTKAIRPWSPAAFLAAIEAEDEEAAVALLNGALRDGFSAADLAPVLVEAALSHYADFGHALIYAVQSVRLACRLGSGSAAVLLPMLVRAMIYATREDLLPEFRAYAPALAAWGGGTPDAAQPLDPALLRRTSAKSAMALVSAWGSVHPPEVIFPVLIEAAGRILLTVDERLLTRPDASLADNIGWLDFSHALTFAEAGLWAVELRPDLWPAVLLQLACFIGRNAGYVDPGFDEGPFRVRDIPTFLDAAETRMLDHGRDRFIISVHLLKTLAAGRRLIAAAPDAAPVIASALNRFLSAPMKGRHVLRTALQMRDLVALE